MEANGSAVEVRLRTLEQRTSANHDSIRTLRDQGAGHETKITVINTELREAREDIHDLREEERKRHAEQRSDLSSLKKAFWVATGALASVFIALCGLLVTIAGNH